MQRQWRAQRLVLISFKDWYIVSQFKMWLDFLNIWLFLEAGTIGVMLLPAMISYSKISYLQTHSFKKYDSLESWRHFRYNNSYPKWRQDKLTYKFDSSNRFFLHIKYIVEDWGASAERVDIFQIVLFIKKLKINYLFWQFITNIKNNHRKSLTTVAFQLDFLYR